MTIGSKEGLAHLMLATLDHGDTVLVPNPSYPIHIYGAVIAGAQVRSVPLVEGVDFFNELERAIRESYPKPKMMILGFPSNPTAQCVELEFLKKWLLWLNVMMCWWCTIWRMPISCTTAGKRHPLCRCGARDVAVEFFTLSKSYNMAGWRIGFMVGNKTRSARWRALKVITIMAPLPRFRWQAIAAWKAISSACAISPSSINVVAMCW